MWIFYSNLILQENTTEAKISTKTRRDQPTRRNEVAAKNQCRDLKIKLTTRMTKATSERGRDTTLMSRRGSTNRAIEEASTKKTKLQLVFK